MYILRIYLLIINIITFTLRGKDKRIARTNGVRFEEAEEKGEDKRTVETVERISEKTLLIMSVIGGWLGGYIAMIVFRHKTIKGSFLWKFWGIVIVWLVVLGWLIFK